MTARRWPPGAGERNCRSRPRSGCRTGRSHSARPATLGILAAEIGDHFHAVVRCSRSPRLLAIRLAQNRWSACTAGWPLPPVRIDDHGVGIREGALIFHPAHFVAVHHEVGQRLEAFLQQNRACTELMHAGRVGWLASNEDELLAVRRECRGHARSRGKGQSAMRRIMMPKLAGGATGRQSLERYVLPLVW